MLTKHYNGLSIPILSSDSYVHREIVNCRIERGSLSPWGSTEFVQSRSDFQFKQSIRVFEDGNLQTMSLPLDGTMRLC